MPGEIIQNNSERDPKFDPETIEKKTSRAAMLLDDQKTSGNARRGCISHSRINRLSLSLSLSLSLLLSATKE